MVTETPQPVILSAFAWPNNSALLEAVCCLYVKPRAIVLDATFGVGGWWRWDMSLKWPTIQHDLYTLDGVDFRQLPEADGSVDVVAFDPAYVVPGGLSTSTIKKMHRRYGMDSTEKTPKLQHDRVIAPGMKEITRVLKPRGLLLQKVQPYITSGKYYDGAQLVEDELKDLGYQIVDRFIHLGHPRAQEKGRTAKCKPCKGEGEDCNGWAACIWCNGTGRIPTKQQHSRNNYSMLIVAKAPK